MIRNTSTKLMTRILTIGIIIAAIGTTVIIIGIETFSVSHAQVLTLKLKNAFCNPNNPKLKFVNSTESKICGIPETPTNAPNATAGNTTTPSIIKIAP
jgi:hypothetical protein